MLQARAHNRLGSGVPKKCLLPPKSHNLLRRWTEPLKRRRLPRKIAMIGSRDDRSGSFVPEPCMIAFIRRQDAAAIRTETREVHRLWMNQRQTDRLASLSIPNSDGIIS